MALSFPLDGEIKYNVWCRGGHSATKKKESEAESESHSVVSNSLQPHGLNSPWNSPGQNTGVGSCSLLQGIFPTQGLDPGLPHCRQILYQLSHKKAQEYWSGEPIPFPGNLPYPGIEPVSPALQVDSLPAELWGKPTKKKVSPNKAREENRSRRIPETQRQNWLKPLKSRPSGFLFIWFNKLLNT